MTVPPVLYYSGVWPSPLAYVIPTTGPLLLFGDGLRPDHPRAVAGRVRAWRIPIAVCRGAVVGGQGHVFVRHVVARSGGM